MDALFNRVFGFEPFLQFPQSFREDIGQAEPDADIYESDTEYIVHAALPGVEPQDIHLEATEDSIKLSAQRRSPFQSGMPDGPQGNMTGQTPASPATAAGAQAGGQTGAAVTEGATSQPHTQHRQSRYSNQSQFRLFYNLPMPIDPNNVRANLRNGVLELHLPKQQPVAARPITIHVQADGASSGAGAQTGQSGSAGVGAPHEGYPASKMGPTYMPSAGEDHTAQAQSIGARAEHEAGRESGAPVGGQATPAGTGSPVSSGGEAMRP